MNAFVAACCVRGLAGVRVLSLIGRPISSSEVLDGVGARRPSEPAAMADVALPHRQQCRLGRLIGNHAPSFAEAAVVPRTASRATAARMRAAQALLDLSLPAGVPDACQLDAPLCVALFDVSLQLAELAQVGISLLGRHTQLHAYLSRARVFGLAGSHARTLASTHARTRCTRARAHGRKQLRTHARTHVRSAHRLAGAPSVRSYARIHAPIRSRRQARAHARTRAPRLLKRARALVRE
eukprot:6178644-Pleurochrysis_carterae.AAC.2